MLWSRGQRSSTDIAQAYLEDQTEGLVHSIQSLVDTIRGNGNPRKVKEDLHSIASFVGKIVSETQHATSHSSNDVLRKQADPVVQTLIGCKSKLESASAEGEELQDELQWKEFTKNLPPLAFEVARETKELVQRLDQLDEDDDDFR